ncbi:MAG: hypothetical protein LBT00_09105 [Spirochaetaceae bacterium]|jgi:uncharacterized protein (TIGR03545 family)|nr:hypothetical protein [Spirochaetaceae bacterium]
MIMIKKAPPLFRKPIAEQNFERKIGRFIEIKADKDYLLSIFELKDGFYLLKSDLAKNDIAKLKTLAKAIKANRAWPVRVVPLAGAVIIVAAITVFCLFFMNPLLERTLERALEGAFEARAEVDNFHLNLFRFRIGLSGIRVADRDEPMTNLFQMGRAEIRLLPQAVLKGKIYIEEVSAASIQFGTPRTSSGALPAYPAKKTGPKTAAAETPPLIDLAQFDAMELVRREADNLNSKKLYDEAAAFYNTTIETWRTRVDDSKKQIAELRNAAQPFIDFNITGIDIRNPATIQQVMQLINDGKAAAETVQSAADNANNIVTGLQDDIKNIDALQKSAVNAVQSDIDHLKSYLDFSSGTYNGIIDPVLRQLLTEAAWQYVRYGKRALEVFEKVKTLQAMTQTRQKPEKKETFKGRDVIFPSRQYPSFYLGVLASDFTIQGWKSVFDLRDVSSDPELTGKPVSLKLSVSETAVTETAGDGRFVSFSGNADFRSSVKELFDAEITGGNFPFGVEQGLGAIGIGGFNGMAGMTVKVAGGRDGSVFLAGSADIKNPVLSDPHGTVAQAIAQAVSEAAFIQLGFTYLHPAEDAEGGDTFSVDTNIGSLIMAALQKTVAEYARKAAAELEQAVRSYINAYIGTEYVSNDDLNTLFAAAKGDKDAIGTLQTLLQDKIAEMEKKVRGAAEEKANEATAAAAAAADQAKRQAQEAAENAAREAAKKAEDAASAAAKGAVKGLFGR